MFHVRHGCSKGGPYYIIHACGIALDAFLDLDDLSTLLISVVETMLHEPDGDFRFQLGVVDRGSV